MSDEKLTDAQLDLLRQIAGGSPGERKRVNSADLLALSERGLISVTLSRAGLVALGEDVERAICGGCGHEHFRVGGGQSR